jgi:hypothetical protein
VTDLKQLFNIIISESKTGSEWVQTGQYWAVAKAAVFCETSDQPDSLPKAIKKKKAAVDSDNFQNSYPENWVAETHVVDKPRACLPVDKDLIPEVGETYVKNLESPVDIRYYHPPVDILNYTDVEYAVCITKSRTVAYRLKTADQVLWVSAKYPKEPQIIKLEHNNEIISPVDWIDGRNAYKGFKTMSKLDKFTLPDLSGKGSPLGKVDLNGLMAKMQELQVEKKDVADTTDTDVQKALGDIPIESLDEIPDLEPAKEEPKEEAKEEVVEEPPFEPDPVQELAPETPAERQKRTRRKPVKQALADLQQFTERIADDLTLDKAVEEIRQLRELQIACARRTANLGIFLHAKAADNEKIVSTLKGLLK